MKSIRTKGSRLFATLLTSGEFTQAHLAECLGVSQQTISKWAAGTTRPEDPVTLLRIKAAFGIKVVDWLTEEELAVVRATKRPLAKRQRAPRSTHAQAA